jgi:hypothetical protein
VFCSDVKRKDLPAEATRRWDLERPVESPALNLLTWLRGDMGNQLSGASGASGASLEARGAPLPPFLDVQKMQELNSVFAQTFVNTLV